jgi:hypothetical protein
MLTLFAVVGLTFVFYADSEATSSRTFREAGVKAKADVDPELAFSFFLSQLIYDANNTDGVYSALRGHSLARLMYGFNNDAGAVNNVPFNGVGRLHTGPSTAQGGAPEPGSYNNPFNIDDYYLVNYTYFRDLDIGPNNFLRDPERLGAIIANKYQPYRTSPTQAANGYYTGGINAPYTYPDHNNMFLAIVNADGQVKVPSFFRSWGDPKDNANDPQTSFGPLGPGNWRWYGDVNPTTKSKQPWSKYLTLRPRPADHAGFPAPEDDGGDVKNRLDLPGGNDSIWLDLGAPVVTLPDGRKFKALFAPLIVDLDGKVNLNVHGNIKGANSTHVSNQGWGPWEVNLSKVLTNNGNEWNQLFRGRTNPTVYGRYGKNQVPNVNGNSAAGRSPHYYGQVDFDALGTGGTLLLPGFGAAALSPFPSFPARYANGDATERLNHPLRYNVLRSYLTYNATNDDRVFTSSDLAALLRFQNTGSEALTSDLLKLSPTNFVTAPNAERIRRMVTTHSFDRNCPGATPYIYFDAQKPLAAYQVPAGNSVGPPQGPAIPFPPLAQRTQNVANGEFAVDWRALSAALGRINLNRTLTPYPVYPITNVNNLLANLRSHNGRFDDTANPNFLPTFNSAADQFQQAHAERQNMANQIYRRLLTVTGVAPVVRPAAPTDAELMPRRWLAQLAVNIVDYIDEDDISTPLNFYTAADAGVTTFDTTALAIADNDPELQVPKYWVFGTELPHVVVNEVLAETVNADPNANANAAAPVKVWVELLNPYQGADPINPARTLQIQDTLPVQLQIGAVNQSATGNGATYSPWRVVVSTGLPNRPFNDNVLGRPNNTVRYISIGAKGEFAQPAPLMIGGGAKQGAGLNNAANIPAQQVVNNVVVPGAFLLGPPPPVANDPLPSDPFVAKGAKPVAGTVPDNTPVLQLPALSYKANFVKGTLTDERTTGLTVLVRRLANPHIPFDDRPSIADANGVFKANPWYNPFVTLDGIDKVPFRDAVNAFTAPYQSRGKRQPYAGFTLLAAGNNNNVYKLDANSPVTDQGAASAQGVGHTFGQLNTPLPFSGHYDWLVHLDRQLISPMELLHVSGYQPYQLTQQFIRGNDTVPAQKFQHYVPWFDQDLTVANPPQSHRLYRIFELIHTNDRASGVGNPNATFNAANPALHGLDPVPGSRYPGKININTIWDFEVFAALCDAQAAGNNNPSFFTDTDVAAVWAQMIKLRNPNGTPGPTDKPFWGMASGLSVADQQNPKGRSIEDTLLRSFNGAGGAQAQRLFQPSIPAANTAGSHPYAQYQLLTKIYNNLTTRSNVFAVWVTVGFFQVMDDTQRPVKLGPEIGRSENRHIRHRMFAIVDRTNLASFTGPSTRFNPHENTGGDQARRVPYFAIID